MFKVPDWENDIPKSDTDMLKLSVKKNKIKETIQITNAKPKTKVNGINLKTNGENKNVKMKKKAKNMIRGHKNLTVDDHINNRILRRSLKTNSPVIQNDHRAQSANTIKQNKLRTNKSGDKIEVSKKVKNTFAYNIDNSGAKELNYINTEKNKNSHKHINNMDKEPKSLKIEALNDKTHDVEVNNEENINIQSYNTDEPDKILMNAKRQKLIDEIKSNDVEDILFGTNNNIEGKLNNQGIVISKKDIKILKKKKILKAMLNRENNRNVIKSSSSNKLRERMLERLKAAQFRYLNEKLYTSSGSESQDLFKSDPIAFRTYHEGYQLQVKKWPVNPLDLIVKRIQKMPKTHLIADMGCGEAALSKRVPQTVRSFDLVATTPNVEACNMAHTPLLSASMDAVVFCLALMGTDLTQYLLEANRVLKIGGHLLIAEVESRFENVDSFSTEVQRLGFSLKKLDNSHQVFFFMEFNKVRDPPAKKRKLPSLSLKPCLYKRR